MDDLTRDCFLSTNDCLSEETNNNNAHSTDPTTCVQKTLQDGRAAILDLLRNSLETAKQQLQRQRQLIGRAVASLTNPETAGACGVSDWSVSDVTSANDESSPPVVSAVVQWQRVVTDTWLLMVVVTTSHHTDIPVPSVLLYPTAAEATPTDCEPALTYTSWTLPMPFPAGQPLLSPRPSVGRDDATCRLTSRGIWLCVAVDVSAWTGPVTVHVLVSGCVPPADTYQVTAGSHTLTLSHRLCSSSSRVAWHCDRHTCAALHCLCPHHHCVDLTSAASTSSLVAMLKWCLTSRGGFAQCCDTETNGDADSGGVPMWANIDGNHTLFGCVVWLCHGGDQPAGLHQTIATDLQHTAQHAHTNIETNTPAFLNPSQSDFGDLSSVRCCAVNNNNTSTAGRKLCAVVCARSPAQMAIVDRLLRQGRSRQLHLRTVSSQTAAEEDEESWQWLDDVPAEDVSNGDEYDALRTSLARQCAVASEMLLIGQSAGDVATGGVATGRHALSSGDFRFEADRYTKWRRRLHTREVETARAAVRVSQLTAKQNGVSLVNDYQSHAPM